MKNKRDKHKLNKIVLFIMIAIIVIAILFNMFITYSRITSVEGVDISSSEDTATVDLNDTISDLSDYKATDELTDEDKEDEYQKNYQETTVDDENYLIKTAEWTDKENGEALITINGSLTVEPEETTALYVTTVCYAHGLTEEIIVDNIEYLIENYDYVDFIVVAYNPDSEYVWYEPVTFTSENSESEIRSYVDEMNPYRTAGGHFSTAIIPCLQQYLFGGIGDEYISTDNLINNPIAIYVSFDGFYIVDRSVGLISNSSGSVLKNISEDEYDEYGTEKFFNFLKTEYGDDAYQVMTSTMGTTNFVTARNYGYTSEMSTTKLNSLLGLIHPENYGLADYLIENCKTSNYNYAFTANGQTTRIISASDYGADYYYR